jgi:predicted component of type VI protein secretion system
MPAQLVALTEGPSILLDKPILLFGRHPECDVQLHSRKISRRHCCIAQVNDALVVRDLGSTNGIRVNNERVIEARLQDGDELALGNYRYRVAWPAGAQAKAARQAVAPSPPVARPSSSGDPLESCDEPVPLADDRPPHPPIAQTARSSVIILPKPPPSSRDIFPAPGS